MHWSSSFFVVIMLFYRNWPSADFWLRIPNFCFTTRLYFIEQTHKLQNMPLLSIYVKLPIPAVLNGEYKMDLSEGAGFCHELLYFFENLTCVWESLINSWFNVLSTQIFIFMLFVSAWILFLSALCRSGSKTHVCWNLLSWVIRFLSIPFISWQFED